MIHLSLTPYKWLASIVKKRTTKSLWYNAWMNLLPHARTNIISSCFLDKCFTVGTHSRCLGEKEHPTDTMIGVFHLIKIIHTTRAKRRKVLCTSMAKLPVWVGTWIGGSGLRVTDVLTTTQNLVETLSLTWSLARGWRINGKAISPETIGFIGPMRGILPTQAKKPLSCGPFGTTQKWLMNGGPELLRLLSPNNVSSAFQTLATWLNTSFGIAFKEGVLGSGPPSSCTSFAGLGHATLTISIGSKPSLGYDFLRSLLIRLRFGTSFEAPPFGCLDWTEW